MQVTELLGTSVEEEINHAEASSTPASSDHLPDQSPNPRPAPTLANSCPVDSIGAVGPADIAANSNVPHVLLTFNASSTGAGTLTEGARTLQFHAIVLLVHFCMKIRKR